MTFINDQTGEVPRRGDQRLFLPKIDWHLNDNHTFTATYNRLRWESPAGVQTGATVTRDRAGFGDDFVETDSLNLRLSSTLSSQLINEFRFQWADELNAQFAQPPLAWPANYGEWIFAADGSDERHYDSAKRRRWIE